MVLIPAIVVVLALLAGAGFLMMRTALSAGSSSSPASAATATPVAAASPPATTSAPAPTSAPADQTSDPSATVDRAAYEREFGVFAPVSKSGTGNGVVELPSGAYAGLVTATHDGDEDFVIEVLDSAKASTDDTPVDWYGQYSGTTLFGVYGHGKPTTLKITANGAWTVQVAPVSTAPALGSSARGSQPVVYLYDGPAATWDMTYIGSNNFIVAQIGTTFAIVPVNEISTYGGKVPLRAGPSVVAIDGDGPWHIERL